MKHSKEYEEGRKAAYDIAPSDAECPYKEGTVQCDAWHAGAWIGRNEAHDDYMEDMQDAMSY